MKNLINRFITEEDGMEILEWAIVAVLFVVVMGTAFTQVADDITTQLNSIVNVFTTSN